MPGIGRSINVATVRTNFIADTRHFENGIRQAVNLQGQLTGSLAGTTRAQRQQNQTAAAFAQSLRATLVATAAYTVAIDLSRRAIQSTLGATIQWDRGLIQVAKTADLTDRQVRDLSEGFESLLTSSSALGDNQALPVASRELLRIAEIAGQMRIQGVPALQAFTETVSLLTLTTDLTGDAAANALGKIIALTDAVPEESLAVGSAITALGNQVRGGERDILKQAESIAAATSLYELSARTLLGLAAVFAQAGTQAESAGTVIQRTLQLLANATEQQVALIANAARIGADELRELIEGGDRDAQLRVFIRALANLPETAREGSSELTRAQFLETVFGEANVRITRQLGVLARDEQEFLRILELSNDEFEKRTALTDEASRAAEKYEARLLVVGNALESQGRAVGNTLLPALTAVAEQYRLIELLAIGAAGAIGSHFLYRAGGPVARGAAGVAGLRSARARSREILLQAERQRDVAVAAQRDAQARALRFARQPQFDAQARAAFAQSQAAPTGPLFLQGTVGDVNRRYSAEADRRALRASGERTRALEESRRAAQRAQVAERRLATVTQRLGTRFSAAGFAARAFSGAIGFLGGPLGIITTGLTVLLATLTLFPNALRRAAVGTSEFIENFSAGDVPRLLEASEEASSAEELAMALDLLREAQARLDEQSGGGHAGRRRRAARDEIQGRIEEIEAIQNYVDSAEDFAALEARIAAIDAELADLPLTTTRRINRAGRTRTSTTANPARAPLEAERARLQALVDSVNAARTTVPESMADLTSRLEVSLSSVTDLMDAGTASAQAFFDSLRNADISSLERAAFAAEQARREEGPDRADRFRFDAEQSLRERRRSLESELGRLDRQRVALEDQQATIQSIFDRFEQPESELGSANFQTLQDNLEETGKRLDEVTEKADAARAELAALDAGAGQVGGNARARAIAEFAAERAEIDRRSAPDLAEAESQGRLTAIALERDLELQIAEALREKAAVQAALDSPADRIAYNAELSLTVKLEAERLALTRRLQEAEEETERLIAERAEIDTTSTLEEDIRRYRELSEAIAEAQVEGAEASAALAALGEIPLDSLIGDLAAILLEIEHIEAAANRPFAVELRNKLVEIGEDGRLVFENLLLAVENWVVESGRLVGDTFTQQLLSGEDGWREFADSVINQLLRILVQAVIVQNVLLALSTAFPGLFGGGTPAAASTSGPQFVTGIPVGRHSGGLIDRAPAGAFQSNLRGNERIAILEVDEEVLTRHDPRHRFNLDAWAASLPRFHEGGLVGRSQTPGVGRGDTNLRVELVNESQTPLAVEAGETRFDAEGMVQQVILADVRRRGPISRSLGGGTR